MHNAVTTSSLPQTTCEPSDEASGRRSQVIVTSSTGIPYSLHKLAEHTMLAFVSVCKTSDETLQTESERSKAISKSHWACRLRMEGNAFFYRAGPNIDCSRPHRANEGVLQVSQSTLCRVSDGIVSATVMSLARACNTALDLLSVFSNRLDNFHGLSFYVPMNTSSKFSSTQRAPQANFGMWQLSALMRVLIV